MRVPLVRPALAIGLCALVVSGCSSVPKLPNGAASVVPAPSHSTAAPATKSSVPATAGTAPVQENEASQTDAGSTFDNLEVIDPSLKEKLAVLRVGSEPSPNDLLSVFVGLKNKTPHPLALQVQTLYKDQAGDPLNAGSWIRMTLKPHGETEYRSTSISAEAVDFLVRVRRAPDGGAAGAN